MILDLEVDGETSRLLAQLGDLDDKWLEDIYLEGTCFGGMKYRVRLGGSVFDTLLLVKLLVLPNRMALYVRRCPTSKTLLTSVNPLWHVILVGLPRVRGVAHVFKLGLMFAVGPVLRLIIGVEGILRLFNTFVDTSCTDSLNLVVVSFV